MRHHDGAISLGLTNYMVRQNDDGRGWTARGDHRFVGPVVLGVRAEQYQMHRRVFGQSKGYSYVVFIHYRGQEKNYRQRAKPTVEQVYDWTGYQLSCDIKVP